MGVVGHDCLGLDLSYNELTTISGVKGFKQLQELILDNNKLDNLKTLPHIPTLTTLSLNNNKVRSCWKNNERSNKILMKIMCFQGDSHLFSTKKLLKIYFLILLISFYLTYRNQMMSFSFPRYSISTKPSIGYGNVVPMWNTWVFWVIPVVPISWPIRYPPMKTITSVTGYTPFTFYLRVFAFWTLEKSLSRRDWMPRLAASIPKRLSWSRNWFASSYPVRRMPIMSSMIYISTFITRPCRTRCAILRITEVRMANASIDIPARIRRATDSSRTMIFKLNCTYINRGFKIFLF